MSKSVSLRKLAFTAILIALQIVLSRYLGIQAPTFQISFGFLPIAISAMLLGPVWAAATAVLADVIGTVLAGTGAYNPMFSINAVLYALIFAFFFYNKEKSPKRIITCVLVQFALVAVPLTPLWLYIYFKYFIGAAKAFGVIFMQKLIASAIEIPIKILVLMPVCRYLYPQLESILKRKSA